MDLAYGILAGVLLAFQLYLLGHWDKVRRPMAFLASGFGMLIVFLGNFFLIGAAPAFTLVAQIFYSLGLLIAGLGSFAACYPGELPALNVQRKQDSGPRPPVSVNKV